MPDTVPLTAEAIDRKLNSVALFVALRKTRDKLDKPEDRKLFGRILSIFAGRERQALREAIAEMIVQAGVAPPAADGEFLKWLIEFLWEHREELINLIMMLFAV